MFRKAYFVPACAVAVMLGMPFSGMAEEAAGMPTMQAPQGEMPMKQGQSEPMPMMMGKKCMMGPEMRAQRREMMQQHMHTVEQHLTNIEALLKQLVEQQKAQ